MAREERGERRSECGSVGERRSECVRDKECRSMRE